MGCESLELSGLLLLLFSAIGVGAWARGRRIGPRPGLGQAIDATREQVDRTADRQAREAQGEAQERIRNVSAEPDAVAREALPNRRARLQARLEKFRKGKR